VSDPDTQTAAPPPEDPQQQISALIGDLTSGDDQRAEASVTGLKQYGSRNLPAISALLDASDANVRWWAVRSLAELNDRRASDLIIRALEDEDTSVRQCAALAISQHADERAIPGLIKLLSDPDSLLARLASNALVAIGPPAVPALLDALSDGRQVGRFEVVRALAIIGDPRAIAGLMGVLEEDSALLEYWADEGLRRMGVGMLYFSP
jgi:HEAT repeats/PBS lyase HEAT-like repeat